MDNSLQKILSKCGLKNIDYFYEGHKQKGIENNICVHTIKIKKDYSVILFGSTGHGKSTLCNFLSNSQKFQESDDPEPCTRVCQTQKIEVILEDYHIEKNIVLNIKYDLNLIDTPSLNESDIDFEMKNFITIIKEISDKKTLNYLILCSKYDEKMDDQSINSLNYYKQLFKQIFNQDSFGIVLTKMPTEKFNKIKDINEYIMVRRKTYKKSFNQDITDIYLYSSISDDKKYKLHGDDFKRNMLLTIFQKPHYNISNVSFPLPPRFEQIRIEILKTIDSNIATLNRAFKKNAENVSISMEEVQKKFLSIDEKENENIVLIKKIEEKSKTIYDDKCIKYGDKIITFKESVCVTIISKYKEYVEIYDRWNCEFKEIERTSEKIVIKVKPDNINIRKYKDHNWYFSCQLTYDGIKFNEKDISNYQLEMKKNNELIGVLRKDIEETTKKIIKPTNKEYNDNFEQYNELYYLREKISKQEYNSKIIYELLALLLTINKNGIYSIDFNSYPDYDQKRIFGEHHKNMFDKDIKSIEDKTNNLIH